MAGVAACGDGKPQVGADADIPAGGAEDRDGFSLPPGCWATAGAPFQV